MAFSEDTQPVSFFISCIFMSDLFFVVVTLYQRSFPCLIEYNMLQKRDK
jgi:hypothetical protein